MYKLPCGCIPDASGFGYCDTCTKTLRDQIWRSLSKQQKDYDRLFAPQESAELDDREKEYNSGCSCHINPPCSYCTSKNDEDE